MKILAELTILLLRLGAGTAARHRLKGTMPSNTGTQTWSPTVKPTKVGFKVGKEKGVGSDNDEITEMPSLAPGGFNSKGEEKGNKGNKGSQPSLSPTLRPTSLPHQTDISLMLTLPPTTTAGKEDSKAPVDGKAKNDDGKQSQPLSPTKDPKGSTDSKGTPDDLETLDDDMGLEPKGVPKGQDAEDDGGSDIEEDTVPEPKGAPKGPDVVDEQEPEPKGAPKGPGTEEAPGLEAKGAPKGPDIDEDTVPAPKGAPKGPGTEDDAPSLAPKGAPKGPNPDGDSGFAPKGPDTNAFLPPAPKKVVAGPTKKASAPVEVHMIGVKVASKHKGNAPVVSTIDDCAQTSNMMTKKLAFSSPCTQDPAACGLAGGTKKKGGKRNLKKSSCAKTPQSSSKSSKKRGV